VGRIDGWRPQSSRRVPVSSERARQDEASGASVVGQPGFLCADSSHDFADKIWLSVGRLPAKRYIVRALIPSDGVTRLRSRYPLNLPASRVKRGRIGRKARSNGMAQILSCHKLCLMSWMRGLGSLRIFEVSPSSVEEPRIVHAFKQRYIGKECTIARLALYVICAAVVDRVPRSKAVVAVPEPESYLWRPAVPEFGLKTSALVLSTRTPERPRTERLTR